MFEALISSGARIGELLDLDVEDVLAPGGIVREMIRLHTSKQARKSRWAALAPQARDAIAAYLETRTTGPLFLSIATCGRGGGRLTYNRAWSLWKSIFAALGFDTLGLATHSFRKTFVELRRKAGWSTADMMQATGHAHLASFEKYVEVGAEELAARNEAVLAVLDRAPVP